jgi:sugar O-acyltransferase (sialic acid O-acetyltransferase NeuD family)
VKPIVLIGAGGSGREVLEILKDQNKVKETWDILGFIDDNRELEGKLINSYPVLGGLDWLKGRNPKPVCICTVNDCEARKEIVRRLGYIGVDFVNVIHPTACIGDSVNLGNDIIIYAGSLLTANIEIGDHVHINFGCGIGHDVVIGRYSTVSGLVNVNGYARLGEGVFLGSGAVVIPRVTVGDWSTIGAGAAVIDDIPERVVAVGVPARPVRTK